MKVRILFYVLLCALTLPKSYVFAFSEQRKFIGQEYDAITGLDYLNARYYDAKRGQFTSQDPMFWNPTPELLADPQQLNSYSYARNNPIISSDPSGLLTIYNPGTFMKEKNVQNSTIINQIGKTFNEPVTIFSQSKGWSGGDTDYARRVGGQKEADFINSYQFKPGEKLNIVGHSHGGNVALIASNKVNHSIDNLVTLGTPIRNEYQPDLNRIKNLVNIYSNTDGVQSKLGGNNISTLAKIYSFVTANPILFALSSMYEVGSANRTMKGAQNINASDLIKSNSWGNSHGQLINNSEVWQKKVAPYVK